MLGLVSVWCELFCSGCDSGVRAEPEGWRQLWEGPGLRAGGGPSGAGWFRHLGFVISVVVVGGQISVFHGRSVEGAAHGHPVWAAGRPARAFGKYENHKDESSSCDKAQKPPSPAVTAVPRGAQGRWSPHPRSRNPGGGGWSAMVRGGLLSPWGSEHPLVENGLVLQVLLRGRCAGGRWEGPPGTCPCVPSTCARRWRVAWDSCAVTCCPALGRRSVGTSSSLQLSEPGSHWPVRCPRPPLAGPRSAGSCGRSLRASSPPSS